MYIFDSWNKCTTFRCTCNDTISGTNRSTRLQSPSF